MNKFVNNQIVISLPRALSKDSEMDLIREGKRYIVTYAQPGREVQLEYFGSYTEAISRYYQLVNTPVN